MFQIMNVLTQLRLKNYICSFFLFHFAFDQLQRILLTLVINFFQVLFLHFCGMN